MSTFDLSVRFFFQLAFILVVCRAVGALAQRLGQPQVVGEMIAGVLMGPSLFGMLAPEWQAWVFPKASMPILFAVSQVGLALYMFLVGVEFNHGLIARRAKSAAAISIAGIAVPFALGALAASLLAGHSPLFSAKTSQLEGMLFLGAAMSITAFPMLARIIYERGLTGTSVGTLALAAGSIDDAAAWCVLAVVLSSFQDNWNLALLAIGGGVLYAAVCLLGLRHWLEPFGRLVERTGLTQPRLGWVLALTMLGAWITDAIHIYAVFGAFIMGLAMPRGRLTEELQRQVGPFVSVFLLPLFFVYSGLNTQLNLVVDSWTTAGVTVVLLLCAIGGKGVACTLAARSHGESWRESLGIGALMNARGLMELIILNIGLERGVITPTLFTMMTIMAIVTTLMATPLFERVYGRAVGKTSELA
jgi:Kef-type K+ transport system membrane component KefB